MVFLRSSLRNKLLLALLVPTALTLALYGVFAYAVARTGLEQELGLRLEAVGLTLSSQLSGGVQASQLERLEPGMERVIARQRARLEATRQQTRVRRVFIFDRELRSLVDTRQDIVFGQRLYGLDADRLEIERTFGRGEPVTSVLFEDEDGTRYKHAYVPIFLDEERTQVVAALGVEASASYFDLLTHFTRGLGLVGALGMLLVALAAALFARRLTRPVHALVEAAQRLGRGDLAQPVVEGQVSSSARADELTFLAYTFEEMRCNILNRDQQLQMMLSGIAHEVRNPLGGMELFCGLLHEDLCAEPDLEARQPMLEKVERIQRELGYLAKVVNDFLDFARHKPLEPERFGAQELLDEVAHLLFGQVFEAGCELVCQVQPEGLELTGDRERLRRALINAARNAYQASPSGGQIVLRALEPSPGQRLLQIEDHGEGIPAEKMQEILTPFFTTREKGSGLGLALIQKIAQQHGGQMSLTSQVGQGTCVTLALPFDEQLKPSEPAIPEGWLG